MQAPKTTDTCAVLAFAFAMVGLWVFPILFGPAAFILGLVSKQRIQDSSGTLKGTGLQIAGGLLGFGEILLVIWGWKQAGLF